MVKPTTVYIESKLLQAVKMKAVQAGTSVSRLVNDALKLTLREDLTDLASISSRHHEPAKRFEAASGKTQPRYSCARATQAWNVPYHWGFYELLIHPLHAIFLTQHYQTMAGRLE